MPFFILKQADKYNNMLLDPTRAKATHLTHQSKQTPLYFTNTPVDTISKTLTTFGGNQSERIIYMGPRYTSTLKLLRAFAHSQSRTENTINDSEIYGQKFIPRYSFVSNQKQKYNPVRANEYRLFTGVNPTAKKDELRFDSNFQCGNLDLVVSLGNNQYDLFLRVDSNTKGHTCWFFFRVENFIGQQRAKFNIVNFSRSELSYEMGMKVYTYASSAKKWVQAGQSFKFSKGHKLSYIDKESAENFNRFYALSFQYGFNIEDEFVYFAYCIPYSYSYLEQKVKELESKHSKIVEADRSKVSTGGLVVPILTITNRQQTQENKECCLIIGRLHPGQTQGSWLLQGFLNFLCSPKAKQIRDKVLFKIVPMVNVDGVVAGNFRTNFIGKDLNRHFHRPQSICQIGLIRQMVSQLKPFMFLDFHGHSSRKNIFTYGPDYPIDHRFFLFSRLFPKLISKCTKSFRYNSCNFRIPEDKCNTGRAVMLRSHQIIYCFTIEGSAFAYGKKRQEVFFDRQRYLQSGSMICVGLEKFVNILFALPKRYSGSKGISTQKVKEKLKGNVGQLDITPEHKKIFQQILNEESEKHSEYDKELVYLNDSDFEEGNDYSEKQLNRLLKVPSQEACMGSKKSNKITRQKLFVNKSYKNHSLHTQSNVKIQSTPKLSDDEGNFDYSHRKIKNLGQINDESPVLAKDHSESLQLNIGYNMFPDKQSLKMRCRHIKTLFSQQSCIISVNPIRLQSLNHLSLDYSVNKSSSQYEPLSQARKIKEKAAIMIKKRKAIEELRLAEQSDNTNKERARQIKKTLLPILGNNTTKKAQITSHIEQIFQKREQQRRNRIGRQIKILHF